MSEDSSAGYAAVVGIFIVIFAWNMTPSSLKVLPVDCDTGKELSGKAAIALRISPLQRVGLASMTANDGTERKSFWSCAFLDSDNWQCDSPDNHGERLVALGGLFSSTGYSTPFACGETRWHRYVGQYWDKFLSNFDT